MNRNIKKAIKIVIVVTLIALGLFIAVCQRPSGRTANPEFRIGNLKGTYGFVENVQGFSVEMKDKTIIHLRTQDPLEVQSEVARWAMQPGTRSVRSYRQADGTTEIVLIAGR